MKGIVSFYEKPGCKGNARQKQQLKDAGYVVQSVDMMGKTWPQESLKKFFKDESPHRFLNERAPAITSGALAPAELSEDALLASMIASPILIQRPLLFYRGAYAVGFDSDLVKSLLGVEQVPHVCERDAGCD